MRHFLVALLLASFLHANDDKIPLAPPRSNFPDQADQIIWPLKGYPSFAKGSIGHLGTWLLDAPAGKHGHVKTLPDGSLAFADGTPARFWGTTTTYATTFPDDAKDIIPLADAIAARGYNMVRFHHNDLPWAGIGFIKPGDNAAFNAEWMDRLDRFAAELIKRGIYLYLDVVDSRHLFESDGLYKDFPDMKGKGKGEGWKGLFPHPKIIESWKRAVTALLQHKNPYTGRTWGEEPALITVEIINENGPFWDWSFKVSDSVRQWYDHEWNTWLLRKYGGREELATAWTDVAGVCGLFADEDPAKKNVFRPRLQSLLDWDRPYRSKTRGAARVNDYYAHLADQSMGFYKQATKHIRQLGFKGVILGSHELQGPLNRYSESVTGAVGAHLYARPLPAWFARPSSGGSITEGVDVKTTNWFSNIPRIKVEGLSSVNGEWAAGSMMHRADANIAVAAATAFQGVDQSLHFSYGHRWRKERMKNYDTLFDYVHWRKAVHMTFSSSHDIPWMIANRICAPLFIRGDLQKPKYAVHIAYSQEDLHEQNLHALGKGGGNGTVGNAALFLPLLHNVECKFFGEVYDGNADVVFSTGRSASGDYSKAKHAVLIGDNPYNDRYHKTRDLAKPARTVHPSLRTADLKSISFDVTWPYAKKRTLQYSNYEGAIVLASIPKGAQAIGLTADGKHCMGWLDDKYLVLPNGRAYGKEIRDQSWLYRLYLAACKRWNIDLGSNSADAPFYQSDTKELTVDWGYGTLIIDTPKTQGFSGLAGWRKENRTRDLMCNLNSTYANILVTSCDNQEVSKSKRLLLVAVGRMKNTNQIIKTKDNGQAKLVKAGKGPCIVEGLRADIHVRTAGPHIVYALNHEGKRLGKVPSTYQDGMLRFALSPKWQSIWFEICAPDIEAPATVAKAWPATEQPRQARLQQPELVKLSDYLALAPKEKAKTAASTKGDMRVQLVKFGSKLTMGGYGNLKLSTVTDLKHGKVTQAQYGKVNNKDWYGGYWLNLAPPSGVRQDDVTAFGIRFKGDGTLPREAFFSVGVKDGPKYRTKANLNTLFEKDSWQDITLKASDFKLAKKKDGAPTQPDLSKVNRIDFTCVGPLMANKSVGRFAELFLLVKRRPGSLQPIKVELPKAQQTKSSAITVPYLETAAIRADGIIDETAWAGSFALSMNERHVPSWHPFGSFVVAGKRANDESADFWLLGTKKGLAIIAKVNKGGKDVVAENKEWWKNDCFEVFSDPTLSGKKPFTQLFMAYRSSKVDLPAANSSAIEIGRAKIADGYLLETVIPWELLGVKNPSTQPFGLELQIDFAAARAGRVLQMVYGTGTNEAWISAKSYLKVTLAPVK